MQQAEQPSKDEAGTARSIDKQDCLSIVVSYSNIRNHPNSNGMHRRRGRSSSSSDERALRRSPTHPPFLHLGLLTDRLTIFLGLLLQ